MKEIINVLEDKELGMIEVMIRVPEFQNFGQRMGELERQSYEALMANPPDLSDTLNRLCAQMEQLSQEVPMRMDQLLHTVPESRRQVIEQMMKDIDEAEAEAAEERIDEDDDEVEEDEEENPEGNFQYDLQQLTVSIPPGMKWDSAAEAVVDQFLANWPAVRTTVLEATADYYKVLYSEMIDYIGNDPSVEITLPKPDGPAVVADLFRITTLHLRDDGGIGLSGHCTWDDEHGYGVLLKDGKIETVGHASEAFD